MLDETLGKWDFGITFVGSYAIYYPMHHRGFMGVRRRYYAIGTNDFIPGIVTLLNVAITLAALVVGAAQMIFFYNVVRSLRKGNGGPDPGVRPRSSGRPSTRRPRMATSARTFFPWCIAGPTTSACQACRRQPHPAERAAGIRRQRALDKA